MKTEDYWLVEREIGQNLLHNKWNGRDLEYLQTALDFLVAIDRELVIIRREK